MEARWIFLGMAMLCWLPFLVACGARSTKTVPQNAVNEEIDEPSVGARPASKARLSASELQVRLCGNGRVDEGEVCDPKVDWDDDCPPGFGVCYQCTNDCQSKVLSADGRAACDVETFVDGKLVGEFTRISDSTGNPLSETWIEHGVVVTQIESTYDKDRNLIRRETRKPDSNETMTISDEGRERVIKRLMVRSDQRLTSTVRELVDEKGRLSMIEEDRNGDGIVDTLYKQNYSSDGKLSSIAKDEDADGVFESKETWRYQENSLRSHVLFSQANDVQYVLEYEYDESGRLRAVYENRVAHKKEAIERREYNAKSDVARVILGEYALEYRYDENDQLDRVVARNNEMTVVGKVLLRYDGFGNRTEISFDLESDGSFDFRHFFSFDQEQRLVEERQVEISGETLVNRYEYDINGNRTRTLIDADGDGRFEKEIRFDNSCFAEYDDIRWRGFEEQNIVDTYDFSRLFEF